MKILHLLILLAAIIAALILTPYFEKLHFRLQASCEATGGSYLGGACHHPF